MQAVTRLGGATSSRRLAPMYWNLGSDWATMAMRIACATKRKDKPLKVDFAASEMMCLAELLKQKQDVQSICVHGKASVTCLQLQKPDQGNNGTMLWTQRYNSKEIISNILVDIGHFTRVMLTHLDCILVCRSAIRLELAVLALMFPTI